MGPCMTLSVVCFLYHDLSKKNLSEELIKYRYIISFVIRDSIWYSNVTHVADPANIILNY